MCKYLMIPLSRCSRNSLTWSSSILALNVKSVWKFSRYLLFHCKHYTSSTASKFTLSTRSCSINFYFNCTMCLTRFLMWQPSTDVVSQQSLNCKCCRFCPVGYNVIDWWLFSRVNVFVTFFVDILLYTSNCQTMNTHVTKIQSMLKYSFPEKMTHSNTS